MKKCLVTQILILCRDIANILKLEQISISNQAELKIIDLKQA